MSESSSDIVVTGAGLATSVGVGREAAWAAIRAGRIGLGPLTAIEDPAQAERGGGEVPRSDLIDVSSGVREAAHLRFALDEALRHAGLMDDPDHGQGGRTVGDPKLRVGKWGGVYDPSRCGIMLGTTLHGMTAAGRMVRTRTAEPLRDFLAPAVIARATAHLPWFEGFAATTCSACSSGLGSILLGVSLLRAGELDLVVAGGYDPISEYAYAGFNSLRLVDERPPRPFARDRAGMKVSEGYAIVVLERTPQATRRGAPVFLYFRGGGESADAHHLTQPMGDGGGAARAIQNALHHANVKAGGIDLIVAHATGTPDNDAAEVAALRSVLGEALRDIPVVGLKSRLGHTLGAAGAGELILAGCALRDDVPPTTATTTPGDVDFQGFSLSHPGRDDAGRRPLRTTLSTSLGFGGANTCVVVSGGGVVVERGHSPVGQASSLSSGRRPESVPLAKGGTSVFDRTTGWKPVPLEASAHPRDVCITGLGIIAPGCIGFDAFTAHLRDGRPAVAGPIAEDDYLHLLSARRVRRLSDYVKLTLAAATLAFEDAGLGAMTDARRDAFTADCPGLLGTMHGSTHYSYDYYRGIVDDGLSTANPMLFAEGVPNAGAAHLSMAFQLRGACQSIIGSRTAGLDALRLAATRIALGEVDRAVVCAGEEHDELVERCYAELGLPMRTCAAAVTLVLESRATAEARGARVRGVVRGGWQVNYNRHARRGVSAVRRRVAEAGGSCRVIDSGGETWLGRFEAAAVRGGAGGKSRGGRGVVSSLRGHFAECFSAGPLLGVASALADRGESLVLGSDFNGLTSGIQIVPNA